MLKNSTHTHMLNWNLYSYPTSKGRSLKIILTHWGRVTHICVGKQTIIGSDNGLSPWRGQAIIWTNAEILLIGPLGTYFSEISIESITFSFKKMHLKKSSGKWRPFCLGLNVSSVIPYLSTDTVQIVWMWARMFSSQTTWRTLSGRCHCWRSSPHSSYRWGKNRRVRERPMASHSRSRDSKPSWFSQHHML